MYNVYSKGRWYRFFLESDGETTKITEADLEVTNENNILKFPDGFHVVDVKHDINSVEHVGNVSMIIDLTGFADGSQGISAPVPKAYDYAYIYVFGYFN